MPRSPFRGDAGKRGAQEFFKHFASLAAREATGFVARNERTWTPYTGVSMGQSVPSKRGQKRPTLVGDSGQLAQEITCLQALDRPALRQKWAALFGSDPSPNLGRALLIRAIAYRL